MEVLRGHGRKDDGHHEDVSLSMMFQKRLYSFPYFSPACLPANPHILTLPPSSYKREPKVPKMTPTTMLHQKCVNMTKLILQAIN